LTLYVLESASNKRISNESNKIEIEAKNIEIRELKKCFEFWKNFSTFLPNYEA